MSRTARRTPYPRGRTPRQQRYSAKLLDPRWVKKRRRILARDGYTCRLCRSTKRLHVHHRWYKGEPWEVPDEALVTLCVPCHARVHRQR